jgi:hypothetical protein
MRKSPLREKHWIISKDGIIFGYLKEDLADDAKDAVLNWADENLTAELEEVTE